MKHVNHLFISAFSICMTIFNAKLEPIFRCMLRVKTDWRNRLATWATQAWLNSEICCLCTFSFQGISGWWWGGRGNRNVNWGIQINIRCIYILKTMGAWINFSFSAYFSEKLKAVPQRCSSKKVFCKYTVNLWENTHAEVWIQKNCPCLLNTFFEEHLMVTSSEKSNFFNFLNKNKLSLAIQMNVNW